jgi:hypothetical protein
VRTEAGHRWGVAKSAYDLGSLLCATGDRTGGVPLLRRALRDFEAIGDPLAADVRDRLTATRPDPA